MNNKDTHNIQQTSQENLIASANISETLPKFSQSQEEQEKSKPKSPVKNFTENSNNNLSNNNPKEKDNSIQEKDNSIQEKESKESNELKENNLHQRQDREREKEIFEIDEPVKNDNISHKETIVSAKEDLSSFAPYPKILISEIQISGIAKDGKKLPKEDFVEIYNSSNKEICLMNWYIQRKTKNSSKFSSYVPKKLFFGKTIKPKGYFLIANASSNFSADIYTDYPLTESNTLVLKNQDKEIIDKLGWGIVNDFEAFPAQNPLINKSLGRIWDNKNQTYFDLDNNSKDFEIQEPSPRERNKPLEDNNFLDENKEIEENYVPKENSIEQIENNNKQENNNIEQTNNNNQSDEQDSGSVIFSEIAWMGTNDSSFDEWIELYNNTNEDIDVNEWGIYEQGGETLIEPLTGIIKANSYYLIERTDDTTVSNIPASQEPTSWGGNGLKNSGEHLKLIDKNSKIIDKVNCSSQWFEGNNKTKQTMERINMSGSGAGNSGNNSSNWQTSENCGGTPKMKNSAY
ncbi:MAG: lamin tail domain-containing protein [Patescibacteria group bacterium]|nr:lamin tail domain-containing protein [Patescibacteria group bacterium]